MAVNVKPRRRAFDVVSFVIFADYCPFKGETYVFFFCVDYWLIKEENFVVFCLFVCFFCVDYWPFKGENYVVSSVQITASLEKTSTDVVFSAQIYWPFKGENFVIFFCAVY